MKFIDLGDWEQIINTVYTDVIITNTQGIIVYANDSSEYWFDMKKEKMIGESVYDLEEQKVFSPSIARRVIETGKKQTLVQETRAGKILLVTGNFIIGQNQNVKHIVCYAQDITELEKLKAYVKKVEEELRNTKQELRDFQHAKDKQSVIIARSESMKLILSSLNKVATTEASVLFTGESGVGKSFLAEYLHEQSGRKGKLIKINCGSIPEALLESELFGYRSGAFTGANPKGKKGLIEEAQNGTLFLDEIGELPFNLQAKLLALIQDKKFYSVGDTKLKSVNFRLITATNANIEDMMVEGKFREDLYFRLSVIHIPIPPLREREEDLIAMIMDLMKKFNHQYKQNKELSHETIDCLLNYQWPGNVRELANIIERLILTVDNNLIIPEHLPAKISITTPSFPMVNVNRRTLPEALRMTEIYVLTEAYQHCKSTTKMAKYLGVSQPTIVRKLKKYSGLIKKEDN
ncbi:PAS domain S-box-containing protein [Virgibacillus halotolerans]|uniref:sigma-54 interaction domain-containing protein n=1 Tax=Virgibacillus halotolerans TaxID=1071053 RepID=UPI00195FAF24|nr:sigma 54-interacting transcriptional regulator [Virgibacillus halotolerans]MBM7599067.1 PAS domain S-box-containing protein [Virgibacillus halotolerans]